MTWKHSRLVRVRWKNRRTKRVRAFVAGITAYDQEHAYDIAECIVGCMIPASLPLNIAYEVAILDREARVSDAHAPSTFWERFEAYEMNVEPVRKRIGR